MSVPLSDPAELATPAGTARVLRAFGVRPRKRFGQHFLVSSRVLARLMDEAAPGPADRVLEIGAGLGTLTAALASTGASVIAVEIDDRLIPILRATTAGYQNVKIVHGDVMSMDLRDLTGVGEARPDGVKTSSKSGLGSPTPAGLKDGSLKVAANLPYSIASPLLIRMLESLPTLERAVVTIQSEVAERMLASPGGKTYGALTVAIRYRADVHRVLRVPPGAFYPPPDVDSAVVRLTTLPRPRVAVEDEETFFAVVRAAFGQRRKVLRNALTGITLGKGGSPMLDPREAEAVCRDAGIDPRRRGETLSLEEFGGLAGALHQRARGAGWKSREAGRTHLAGSGGR